MVDSRESADGVRRRRECGACGVRFTTYERAECGAALVVKKDGRREQFSRAKLARGVRLACFKRPVPAEAIDAIVRDIEATILGLGLHEIPSEVVGDHAMRALRDFDEVAYVRFASVCREFRDVESLAEEIEGLMARRRRAASERNQLRLRFEEEQPCWS